MDDAGGANWLRWRKIGEGGFGTVFLATLKEPNKAFTPHLPLPPEMAVKSSLLSDSDSLRREKKVFDQIRGCPHIIRCFGDEITQNSRGEMAYNLLLEYASGGTLADLLESSGGIALSEIDVKRFTLSIVKGISHLHDKGFVHCDLKPDNILIVKKGVNKLLPKIADFGLAKESKLSNFNLSGDIRGTAPYMAPEVVLQGVQTCSCDVWAIGCVVFEMLTGKSIWGNLDRGMTNDEIWRMIRDKNSGFPKIPNWISKEARSFLKECLERKPSFRATIDMLLDHPFLIDVDELGTDEEDCEEVKQKWFDFDLNLVLGGTPYMPICRCSPSSDEEDSGKVKQKGFDFDLNVVFGETPNMPICHCSPSSDEVESCIFDSDTNNSWSASSSSSDSGTFSLNSFVHRPPFFHKSRLPVLPPIIAAGARQELLSKSMATMNEHDASGNKLLHNVGLWLSQKIKK